MKFIYYSAMILFICLWEWQESRNPEMASYSTLFLPLSIFIMINMYKERRINKIKRKLLEKEREESNFLRIRELFQKLLVQRFDMSKQILRMNSNPIFDPKEKRTLTRINEIFYGQPDINFNYNEFYEVLNEIYKNFSTRLSEIFPDLNENEIQICCLLKAGFDTNDICLILKYVSITIRIKKTNIRKKIGITDGGDIVDFLNDFMEEQEQIKKEAEARKMRSFWSRLFK